MDRDRVLVTGGTGFIGSRTVRELRAQGLDLRLIVRNAGKARRLLERLGLAANDHIELVEQKLFEGEPRQQFDILRQSLKGVSTVLHLAEVKSRERDADVRNIKTTALFLEAARKTPSFRRFVFVSAFMAGGLPDPLPGLLTEEMAGREFPDRYYYWKRKAELLLMSEHQFEWSVIRPGLVYGPGAAWLDGMLRTTRRLGRFAIPLPASGSAFLGTVHVDDAARLIATASYHSAARNTIIHAIDNGGTTYRDWFETIGSSAGWKIRILGFPANGFLAIGRLADDAAGWLNKWYGAALWAEVLAKGCLYSNTRMRDIVGDLHYPTIKEGVPGMMKWFLEGAMKGAST